MTDGEGSIEQGIAEAESYANQYIPKNSRAFADQVEEYANSEVPPAFNHASLEYISPLSDNVIERIRSRVGDDSSAVTFVDLQQIVTNEITDLEDQQNNLSEAASKECAKMINRLRFIEEAVLKVVSNEELNTYDRKAIRWYLSHNIDRWNGRTHTENNDKNTIVTQNESYFASLYERFEKKPLVTAISRTEEITDTSFLSETD